MTNYKKLIMIYCKDVISNRLLAVSDLSDTLGKAINSLREDV